MTAEPKIRGEDWREKKSNREQREELTGRRTKGQERTRKSGKVKPREKRNQARRNQGRRSHFISAKGI